MTDSGVAFATTDGRIWFTDGSAPEQIGGTDPDVLGAWRLTVEGGRGARAVVSATADPRPRGSSSRRPTGPRSSSTTPATARSSSACPSTSPPTARSTAHRSSAWTRTGSTGPRTPAPWTCRPCFECEDKVPAAEVYDLASGDRSSLTTQEYAAELSTQTRIIGPRGEPGEVDDGAEPWLDRNDGIGVAGGHDNLTFLAIDGRLQATGAGGLGQILYDLASRTRLRLGRPPALKEGDSFRLFQWLDDDSFALVRAGAFTDGGDMVMVCRLTTKNCETAVPPSASSDLTVPNR